MNLTYLFLFMLVLCWTINPFMKKKIASKMSSSEYMVFNHCLCTVIILIYFIYLFQNNTFSVEPIKQLSKYDLGISVLAASTTVIASILLINLLKNNDASYIIPHVQPCIILLTLLVGYFFYNENVNKIQALGGVLVIAGLFIINKGKTKN